METMESSWSVNVYPRTCIEVEVYEGDRYYLNFASLPRTKEGFTAPIFVKIDGEELIRLGELSAEKPNQTFNRRFSTNFRVCNGSDRLVVNFLGVKYGEQDIQVKDAIKFELPQVKEEKHQTTLYDQLLLLKDTKASSEELKVIYPKLREILSYGRNEKVKHIKVITRILGNQDKKKAYNAIGYLNYDDVELLSNDVTDELKEFLEALKSSIEHA